MLPFVASMRTGRIEREHCRVLVGYCSIRARRKPLHTLQTLLCHRAHCKMRQASIGRFSSLKVNLSFCEQLDWNVVLHQSLAASLKSLGSHECHERQVQHIGQTSDACYNVWPFQSSQPFNQAPRLNVLVIFAPIAFSKKGSPPSSVSIATLAQRCRSHVLRLIIRRRHSRNGRKHSHLYERQRCMSRHTIKVERNAVRYMGLYHQV